MPRKPVFEPSVEPQPEPKPEPMMPPEVKSEPPVEVQPESTPDTLPISMKQLHAEAATKDEIKPEPVKPKAPPARPAMPRKETGAPAAPATSRGVELTAKEPEASAQPSRAGRMLMILFTTLVISGLAAYGVYRYLQKKPPETAIVTAPAMISSEGLQIINAGGSVQPNGDLLITGVIENSTDKERDAWYLVAEVYDAQGGVISRIRLFNGKQVYDQRDYDILAGRGVNIQELKFKTLQDKGIIIPPMGKVPFEMNYLQPPASMASFNTQVLPFDPVQLYKEIAGSAR